MTKLERELTAKVADLEARIKALEARPAQHVHYHSPQYGYSLPAVPVQPITPSINPMIPYYGSKPIYG